MRGIRRAMARNMAEAWRSIPHITLFDEIDARPLIAAHRAAREQSGDDSLTLTAFFVRAAVLALESVPMLNASFDAAAEEIVYHDECHVGIAASTDDGLTVPVIHDAQRRDLYDLGREIVRLTAAARAGGLPPDAPRRDLHRHQLRHRGWTVRDADRPPSAGRHPRLRRDPGAPGRRR